MQIKERKKKAQVNQIFVYVFSIIVVLFAGFLITNFLFDFFNSTDKVLENKFYDKFENDFDKIYSIYGSESVNEYKVTSQVVRVCLFSGENTCIDSLPEEDGFNQELKDDMKILRNAGDNVMMFGNKGLLNSRKVDGEFIIEASTGGECLCMNPIQGKFSLVFENRHNTVYIFDE